MMWHYILGIMAIMGLVFLGLWWFLKNQDGGR